jgi:Xaa-Pro aminopeptidase
MTLHPGSSLDPGPPFNLTGPYPRFSSDEYARRWAALDTLLEEADADLAIVAGHLGGRHEIVYLTNAPVRWESFLVMGRELEPRLFVQLFNHVPTMTRWSVVPVGWAGMEPASTLADHLRAVGRSSATIATLGPWSEHSAMGLRAQAPGARFVSIAGAFARERLIKSAEELAWTAHAARLCDDAVTAFCDAARPGMREDELAWLLQATYADRGGQTEICFLSIVPSGGGRAVVPSQVPSADRIEAGDTVVFELSAGISSYTAQILRTVAVGGEPDHASRELHDIAQATLETIVAAIRPGVTPAELEALGAMIDDAGLTIVDDLVHGYVGGYLPPVLRTPATRHRPPPDLRLAAGMCLVIQPNVVSADRRHGVQTGELVAVTDHGVRRFHAAPQGLLRAD